MLPWRQVCAALVLGHLILALARVPTDVVSKRRARIAEYHAKGPVPFFLDTKELQGVAAVDSILQHAPPDAVVLHRGALSGAIEFVPALIWPRLLYAETWVAGDGSVPIRRPLARVPIDGRDATAILVCDPEVRGQVQQLHLEAR